MYCAIAATMVGRLLAGKSIQNARMPSRSARDNPAPHQVGRDRRWRRCAKPSGAGSAAADNRTRTPYRHAAIARSGSVIPINYPGILSCQRRNSGAPLRLRCRHPAWPPELLVEMDEGQADACRQLACKRALTGTRDADHQHASHRVLSVFVQDRHHKLDRSLETDALLLGVQAVACRRGETRQTDVACHRAA